MTAAAPAAPLGGPVSSELIAESVALLRLLHPELDGKEIVNVVLLATVAER